MVRVPTASGGRDRFMSALTGASAEGNPAFLFDLSLGLDVIGVPSTEVFGSRFNGRVASKAIVALQRLLGHDAVAGSYRMLDYCIFGGRMRCPEHGLPTIDVLPFADPSSLEHADPQMVCGRMDDIIECYRLVRSSGLDAAVLQMTMTPFSTAAYMRGMEVWLMDQLIEPSFSKDMLSFQSELYRAMWDEMLPAEPDGVVLVAPYDNPDLLDQGTLKDACLPGIVLGADLAHDRGLPLMLHPHGCFSSGYGPEALEMMLSVGPECLYYGEGNSASDVIRRAAGRCSVSGGIDTFTTIYLGPDERVVRDTRAVMEEASGSDFIFTCSCSVDRGLDLDRMRLMMDTVRGFGY